MRDAPYPLDKEERAALSLRRLYAASGYARLRMSRFEPYDLYARNKDYLESQGLLTFSDMRGRLLAMRPDVTLSIVKAYQGEPSWRVQYQEQVYRPGPEGDFLEITQVGLERLGEIGGEAEAEVLLLAAGSLDALGGEWALSLSHTGIVKGFVDSLALDEQDARAVKEAVESRNLTALDLFPHARDPQALRRGLRALLLPGGGWEEALHEILRLRFADGPAEELLGVCRALQEAGYGEKLRLDVSQSRSGRYYEGLLFQGYVMGLPGRVLSGGRYDPLMRRMGKQKGGIGFAVYLDQLAGCGEEGHD